MKIWFQPPYQTLNACFCLLYFCSYYKVNIERSAQTRAQYKFKYLYNYLEKWIYHINFNFFHEAYIDVFIFLFPVLMWRMDQEQDHRWREDRPVPGWYYKICHNVASRFSIGPIPILKCHRNQCRAIRALPAKGKQLFFLNLFFILSFFINLRVYPYWMLLMISLYIYEYFKLHLKNILYNYLISSCDFSLLYYMYTVI